MCQTWSLFSTTGTRVSSALSSNRQSSTPVAFSEKRAKFTPEPSQIAPSGYGRPGRFLTLDDRSFGVMTVRRTSAMPAARRRADAADPARLVGLIEASAKRVQRFGRVGIRRRHPHRRLELAQRLPPAPLFEIDPPEVHVRELPGLVARRLLRPLQPRNRLLELALLHEVDADIVVRVAEV